MEPPEYKCSITREYPEYKCSITREFPCRTNFTIFCDLMIGVLPWGPVEVLTPPLTKRRIENAKNLTNA